MTTAHFLEQAWRGAGSVKGYTPLIGMTSNRTELIFRFRRRHWEDVLVNSVFLDGLATLARLAERAGDREIEQWARDHVEDFR